MMSSVMQQITSAVELVGKKIRHLATDVDVVCLFFEDDTFACIKYHDYGGMSLMEEMPDDYEQHEFGLITEAEYNLRREQKRQEDIKRNEQFERDQLARLKAKYEP